MNSFYKFLLLFYFIFIIPYAFLYGQENITVTTYYPAPYGVYQTLRLSPTNLPGYAGTGSMCANNGEIFYSATDNQIIACTNNIWQTLGGSTLWTLTGNNLYPRQNAYNVVIGGQTAVNKLDVEGAAAIGADYAGTNTAPFNGLIVQGNVGIGTPTPSQALEVAGPVRIGTTTKYTLPATDGTSGQTLTIDASGNVSWQAPPAITGKGFRAFGWSSSGCPTIYWGAITSCLFGGMLITCPCDSGAISGGCGGPIPPGMFCNCSCN